MKSANAHASFAASKRRKGSVTRLPRCRMKKLWRCPRLGGYADKERQLTGKHERPAGHVIGDVMNKFERVALTGIIEVLFFFCASAVFGQQNNNGQPTQN